MRLMFCEIIAALDVELKCHPTLALDLNLPHSTKSIFSTCFGSDSGAESASRAVSIEAIVGRLPETCL